MARRTITLQDLHAMLGLPEEETIEYVTSYLGATQLIVHTSAPNTPIHMTQTTEGDYMCQRTIPDDEPPTSEQP